jgi:epoxyqueuosine reductase QueG
MPLPHDRELRRSRLVVTTQQAQQQTQNLLKQLDVDSYGIVSVNQLDEIMTEELRNLLPNFKSVVVLLQEVFQESVRHIASQASVGDIALRDLFSNNSDIANGHLNWEAYSLVRHLHKLGYKGLVLPAKGGPYSSKFLEGPVSFKKLAKVAGLGIIGWNGLLLTEPYGPRVRIAAVVTDVSLETSKTDADYLSPCIKCQGACVKICPIKAIAEPSTGMDHMIDKYACNTYLVAAEGCAECLRVCPGFSVLKDKR